MNFRRRICDLLRWIRGAYRGASRKGTGLSRGLSGDADGSVGGWGLCKTPMVLNVGRSFWRRTEAEFDCLESVTFVKHTRGEVLLMRMEFKPQWGLLLGNVDELCSPPSSGST
jgi:hypothetical protein